MVAAPPGGHGVASRSDTISTGIAVLLGLCAIGLVPLIVDDTPLLTEPSPDPDWPLGLIGFGAGLWSARRITALPYVAKRRFGRLSFWIILPLWLGFGLAALGDRIYEAVSFRHDTREERATVLVVDKARSTTRRGKILHEADVISPFDNSRVTVRVDQAVFDRIEPGRECATLRIERASNGAARLLLPLRWKVPCPW